MAAVNKRQHFVPQHYLRLFRVDDTELVVVARVEPYKYIGPGPIKGQCQESFFYGDPESRLDEMLRGIETSFAPELVRISSSKQLTPNDVQSLRLFCTHLHLRTRKAAEIAKVFPRFMADQVITNAIERGELPSPEGGWKPEMMDFTGVPNTLLSNLIRCYYETAKLGVKLLAPPPGGYFVTSDHPVVIMNQFASDAKSNRSFAGFAQTGFQMIVPIGPKRCVIFYDANVYKVGGRGETVVLLTARDLEALNALQVQSAENCLYAHSKDMESCLRNLVLSYGKTRKPIGSGLKIYPGRNDKEQLIHVQRPKVRLPYQWGVCKYLRHVKGQLGERRDPVYTDMIERLCQDLESNPGVDDIESRVKRLFGLESPALPAISDESESSSEGVS